LGSDGGRTGEMWVGGGTERRLGLGGDPLCVATAGRASAVFAADLFDAASAGLVARNAEGRVIPGGGSAGIPFTAETVARLTDGREPFQAAGAALLRLAWEQRKHLLG